MNNTITCISKRNDNLVHTILACRPDLDYDTVMKETEHITKAICIKLESILRVCVSRAIEEHNMPWETSCND